MAGRNEVILTFAEEGARTVSDAFDRVGTAADGMADDVRTASRQMDSATGSFDRVGGAAGELDTKAMGFRDTMTGVQDTMAGVSAISEGDMFTGFLTLGMGVGDLASGMENLIAPLAGQVATWVSSHAAMAASTVASVGRQIGAWALLGIQSLVHAAKVAAAWLIAMGPVIIVIAIVIAVVALIIWKWDEIVEYTTKAWNWVREKSVAAWNAITEAIGAAVGWVVDTIRARLTLAWTIVTTIWSGVKRATTMAWEFVKTTIGDKLRSAFTTLMGWRRSLLTMFGRIPGMIGRALAPVVRMITAPFRNGFNAIKDIWNSAVGGKGFDVPSWVPGVGGRSFRIPKLAAGGIVTAPTMFIAGEGGANEQISVTPLRPGERSRPSGGGPAVIYLNSAGSDVDEFLVELLRKAISNRGGTVEQVLG